MIRPALARHELTLLALLVGTALCVRLAWAAVIPPYQAPDERAHLRYAEYVAKNMRLPVQPPPELPRIVGQWEQYFQPPLAYILFAPLTRITQSVAGRGPRVLRALRAQNALYGAVTVAIGFLVVASLTPAGDPRRWLVAILLAFLPGFVGATSAVNNDALASLLGAALWLPLIAAAGKTRPWIVGLTLGAACLAKMTVLPLFPLVFVVPLLRGGTIRDALREVVIVAGVAGVLLAPWMVRNVLLYREPFGTSAALLRFDWLAGQLPPELVAAGAAPQPLRAFLQFWGRFGRFGNLSWTAVPALMIPLATLAAAGWVRQGPRQGDALDSLALAFLLAVGLSVIALISYSFRYYAGWQGRYLYPTLLPICVLLACGGARWCRGSQSRAAVGGLALLLLALDAAIAWKLHDFYASRIPLQWGLRVHL